MAKANDKVTKSRLERERSGKFYEINTQLIKEDNQHLYGKIKSLESQVTQH